MMQWILLFLFIFLCRELQLCLLYFCESPIGGDYVHNALQFFAYASVFEACYIFAAVLIFWLLVQKFSRYQIALKISGLILAGIYLLLSAGNDELQRWMGQHLTISFLFTYSQAFADLSLVEKIFAEGFGHFVAEIGSILLGIGLAAVALFAVKRNIQLKKITKILLAVFAAVSVAGILFGEQVSPTSRFYKKAAPIAYHICHEFMYGVSHSQRPSDYAEGIEFLGGDASREYPFFNNVPDERENIKAFLDRPLDEKPDVIFLTIESLRGWAADPKNPEVCSYMPNYCALIDSGAYFPRAYSVGFPSIEGFLGINAGIWTHPAKTFLSGYSGTRFSTLSEILKRAGYYRVLLSAVDPKFDNMQSWGLKWFDSERHSPMHQNDESMVEFFKEAYRNRPRNKPLFLDWLSISTHTPFVVPESFLKTPNLPHGHYEKTLAYFDYALGMLLDEIRRDPRRDNTIIVLAGDHAYPTKKMNKRYQHGVHAGYVWVPMAIIGAGVPQNVVYDRPVSQVDLAPTVLKLLNLEVSNSFVGKNLLDSAGSSAISFRLGDIAVFSDSLCFYSQTDGDELLVESYQKLNVKNAKRMVNNFVGGTEVEGTFEEEMKRIKAAANAWQWVLDNDLLIPKEYSGM